MLAVYGIVNGNEAGWTSPRTVGFIGGGVALFALFLLIESRAKAPLMPLGLFRFRNLSSAGVIGALWSAAMFAWFFVSALYMQLVLGYSAMQVGLAFLPANLIMAAFSLGLSAKMVMRFGIRVPLATGLAHGRGTRPLRAVAGRRQLRPPRAPRHGAARHRLRHGHEPRAARRHERRAAKRVRPRLRSRQYRVHDGRGA